MFSVELSTLKLSDVQQIVFWWNVILLKNLPKAFAIATFSRMPSNGMMATADPSSVTMPSNEITWPVDVSFRLKGGGWNGGSPDSIFPVNMNVVFRFSSPLLVSGKTGSKAKAIPALTTTTTAFRAVASNQTNFPRTFLPVGGRSRRQNVWQRVAGRDSSTGWNQVTPLSTLIKY